MSEPIEMILDQVVSVLSAAPLGLSTATDEPVVKGNGSVMPMDRERRIEVLFAGDSFDEARQVLGLEARVLEVDIRVTVAMIKGAADEKRRLTQAVAAALGDAITVDGVEVLVENVGTREVEISGEAEREVASAQQEFSLFYRTSLDDPFTLK